MKGVFPWCTGCNFGFSSTWVSDELAYLPLQSYWSLGAAEIWVWIGTFACGCMQYLLKAAVSWIIPISENNFIQITHERDPILCPGNVADCMALLPAVPWRAITSMTSSGDSQGCWAATSPHSAKDSWKSCSQSFKAAVYLSSPEVKSCTGLLQRLSIPRERCMSLCS